MSQTIGIKNFAGLYKENNSVKDAYFFCEKIKTRSAHFGWKVDPHFHSQLFQIFLVRNGNTKAYLSAQQYDLEGSFLLFIPPNIIHAFDFDAEIDGEIISFSTYYVNTLLNRFPDLAKHLSQPIMFSNKEDLEVLFDAFHRLKSVFDSPANTFSEISIHIKIADLLLQIVQLQPEKPTLSANIQYSDLEIFKAFQEMVKKEISPFKPLDEYAQQLNISLSHLNRVCRNIENASPLNIIQKEIINMAKILLLNDKVNISDIAYSLGFNDPSYFIRLFKKKVGITPKGFRSQQ